MDTRRIGGFLCPRAAWMVAGAALPLAALEAFPGLRFDLPGSLNGQVHSVLETLSIVVSAMIFSVVWNAQAWARSSLMAIACCSFGAVALADLAHVVLFEPTPAFADGDGLARAYVPFFAARLTGGLALLLLAAGPTLGPVGERRRWAALGASIVLGCTFAAAGCFSTASGLLFARGSGPTGLKIGLEGLLAAVEIAGAFLFMRQFARNRDAQSGTMAAAMLVMVLSQYAFSRYSHASDAFFVYGHVLKVIAYLALYRAMYVWMLQQPYLELVVARRKAAEAGERWRMLFESSLEAALIGTPDGGVVAANPAACRLFGVSEAELVAGARDLVTQPGDSRLAELVALRDRDGHTRGELTFRRPDGTTFEAEVATSRYLDPDGRALTNVMIRDITSRKALEAQRAELNAHLERRVSERTAQLERANADLAQFSYGIAHDLRAPLAAIGGFAGALGNGGGHPLPPKWDHYLARIVANVVRMESVIEAMLALYRLAQSPLLIRDVEIDLIARQIVEDLAFTTPERTVRVEIEPGLAARGDQALLHVLLQNVIGNAWKFTSRRESALIRIGRVPGHDSAWFVEDNGVGFELQPGQELFSMFRRLHDTADFGGHGLGLASARKIVERHGGGIAIEGRPGQGATLRFSLGKPLVTAPSTLADSPA